MSSSGKLARIVSGIALIARLPDARRHNGYRTNSCIREKRESLSFMRDSNDKDGDFLVFFSIQERSVPL
jgi:hypothetical protein